jgi:hypothetical protein
MSHGAFCASAGLQAQVQARDHAYGRSLGAERRQQSWRASSGWKWGSMKFWKWACVAGAIFVCAILLAGKDDMIRYGKMRRM